MFSAAQVSDIAHGPLVFEHCYFSLPIPTFAFVTEPLPKISQTHNL